MLAYLKVEKSLETDNKEEKIIGYPEQIQSDVGAKVLFDIIAPEVARHSYTYSPYRKDIVGAVAEDVSDSDMEEKIVRFIETLVSKYIETTRINTIRIDEGLLFVDNMINEWDFYEIKEQEKRIAETLQILYH